MSTATAIPRDPPAHPEPPAHSGPPASRPLTVALVNNMPDSAFLDTEDQFRRLVDAGAAATHTPGPTGVRLALHTITEIPRSAPIAAVIEARYRGLDALRADPPDALIVTGTEPTRGDMTAEPAWPALAGLLEWAADAVGTVLLSCLAAHASIRLFDGVERTPRAGKCSGVLRGVVSDPADPLAAGLADDVAIPHSRHNEVPEQTLRDLGYRIVVGAATPDAGWSVAARRRGRAQFVLFQGHPEYDPLSLLREYRRDVRRALFAEPGCAYPQIPAGYLTPDARRRLEDFADAASHHRGDPAELWARFPYAEARAGVHNSWADSARRLSANWITQARAGALAVA